MIEFYKFPSIEAFHHKVKKGKRYEHTTETFGVFPKLHGTNAAIGVFTDGIVTAQSRNRLLTLENDNAGFLDFVRKLNITCYESADLVFYGEWCGGGIQKSSDAICQVEDKYFVIFALRVMSNISGSDFVYNSPAILRTQVEKVFGENKNIIVMKPYSYLDICFSESDDTLEIACDKVNAIVEEFETECPFTKEHFGISAHGEGVVVSPMNDDFDHYSNWTFKAKTKAHTVNKYKKASVPKVEISNDVLEFADQFGTEARFRQAMNELEIEFDKKNLGAFIKWVCQDVAKESKDELEESGLSWKNCSPVIVRKAKEWFLNQKECV